MLGIRQDNKPCTKEATAKILEHLSRQLDIKLGKVKPEKIVKHVPKYNIVWDID